MDTDIYPCDLTVVAADSCILLHTGTRKFQPNREELAFRRLESPISRWEINDGEIVGEGRMLFSGSKPVRESHIPHETRVLAQLCSKLDGFQMGSYSNNVYTIHLDSDTAAIRAALLIHWMYVQFGEITTIKIGF